MKAAKFTKETINKIGTGARKFPSFNAGDSVAVVIKIKEGGKERLQTFEGDVIAIRNRGISSTFTVRKIASGGIAVERIFPYYSPIIDSIKFIQKGKVRRAKLFYLRGRVGRAARVEEQIVSSKDNKEQATENS